MPDTDVVPTVTVNTLDKLVKGEDRDKQLIVLDAKTGEYVDVTCVEPNEDNVVLGTESCPA